MQILYVEDDERVRLPISRSLRDMGHNVIEASDCTSASAIFRAQPTAFDLLLTDIETPGPLNGWQLAVRARRQFPRLHVIYTSAVDMNPALAVVGASFLTEPFTITALRHFTGTAAVNASENKAPPPFLSNDLRNASRAWLGNGGLTK